MRPDGDTLKRGAMAGVLAATAVAGWFLLVDILAGQPLHTPNYLAAAVLGPERVGTGLTAATVLYTVFHYFVFTALGIAAAAALRRVGRIPALLLGLALGFVLFDVMFYAGLLVNGANVLDELGWPQVLVANVLAGVVFMGVLAATGVVTELDWGAVLRRHRAVREGIAAGLIGAAAVAVVFFIFDAASGRLLFTPAALGSALFHGAREAAAVQADAATIVAYTAVHVAAFLVVGLVAAGLAAEAEREPPVVLGIFLLFITYETLFVGLLAIFADWLLASLPWWSVAAGNILSAMAMGVYLWRAHPALGAALREKDRALEAPSPAPRR